MPDTDSYYVIYFSNIPLDQENFVRVYANNNFFEILPHNKYFFLVPFFLGKNKIELEVYTTQNNLLARPIGVVKKSNTGQRMWVGMSAPIENFFYHSMGMETLSQNHKFLTSFDFHIAPEEILTTDCKNFYNSIIYNKNNTYKVVKNSKNYYFSMLSFMRKTFDYHPHCWFKCYKVRNNISYRISFDKEDRNFCKSNFDILFQAQIKDGYHFVKLLQCMCAISLYDKSFLKN